MSMVVRGNEGREPALRERIVLDFGRRGGGATTPAALAARLGVSRPTIVRCLRTHTNLFQCVIESKGRNQAVYRLAFEFSEVEP